METELIKCDLRIPQERLFDLVSSMKDWPDIFPGTIWKDPEENPGARVEEFLLDLGFKDVYINHLGDVCAEYYDMEHWASEAEIALGLLHPYVDTGSEMVMCVEGCFLRIEFRKSGLFLLPGRIVFSRKKTQVWSTDRRCWVDPKRKKKGA